MTPGELTGTRVGVARLVYLVGLAAAVTTAVNGLRDESPLEWAVGPAMGMAIWWIAAGTAVRIGVTPRDFFAWLRSLVTRSGGTAGSS